MKEIPKNLKELRSFAAEKERKIDEKLRVLKEGKEDESLFTEE